MIGAFGKTFFRATPQQLFMQLMIDILWYVIFKPTDTFSLWLYILILPGFDLVSAIGSFWNYVKDNKSEKNK
ncbi:hypothetical protein FKV75_09185 [Weissella paramesenteroides]|jgi:hypothetical protein|uniref:Uncharacterized protein n=2 Tax=Weissella paramesenteroides TaxID=1249 RepID=C5R9H4_WEIPA|nr:hypothetical protein [Weissella paramesenteroides]ATF42157.1 hypothetical protein CO680_08925 [Weissella paramesenteroides]EER75074.1 hypothetical protein HMPREF0877_0619 [Weissella paramesenteroides ATCC 33313]KAA8439811.1 hypothetical protein FKV75_09185 [Weissella paramesenteroides]KAA8441432.1 hypothetical protein FKV81_03680 [Weissella paramesenteroides]KAA8444174.1 hypothetical protein FKV77_01785 [Weissella paramesenteroides]